MRTCSKKQLRNWLQTGEDTTHKLQSGHIDCMDSGGIRILRVITAILNGLKL